MKRAAFFKFLVLVTLILSTMSAMAQFPPGGGGGFPGGRPPGRPGQRPGGDRQWNQQDMQAPTVKQKKKVREGVPVSFSWVSLEVLLISLLVP